jgi:hypothetical protein
MGTVIAGTAGAYDWLEADVELRQLLDLCPEVVAERYLAVTSADSEVFRPSEADLARGWKMAGGIGYSPRLPPGILPACGGYDEWYVFESPRELGVLSRDNIFTTELAPGTVVPLVNYMTFRLSDPRQDLAEQFWKQMAWIQPESYIGDGRDCLNFATRNRGLFTSVMVRLESQ